MLRYYILCGGNLVDYGLVSQLASWGRSIGMKLNDLVQENWLGEKSIEGSSQVDG